MSTCLNLVRLPAYLGEELLQNPERIRTVIYPGYEGNDPAILTDDKIDLDAGWHALHFLFTGTASEGEFPAAFLLSGGSQVGEADVGYGPARHFDAAATAQIDAYLQSLDEAELRGRLDPEEMLDLEIYPEIWDEDEIDEQWEYVRANFRQLKDFVRETTATDKALLVFYR
jgi:hypothetical protein